MITSRQLELLWGTEFVQTICEGSKFASIATLVASTQSSLKRLLAPIPLEEMRTGIMAYLCLCFVAGIHASKCIDGPVNESSCCAVADIRNITGWSKIVVLIISSIISMQNAADQSYTQWYLIPKSWSSTSILSVQLLHSWHCHPLHQPSSPFVS